MCGWLLVVQIYITNLYCAGLTIVDIKDTIAKKIEKVSVLGELTFFWKRWATN